MRAHPPPTSPSPAGDVTTLDRNMTAEDALVHDTLCVMQAPTGMTRLSDMMTAAGLRTQRGTAFSPAEVKRVLDRLLAGSHAARDHQGRVRAAEPHASARFAQMMRDPARATAWFDAWRKLVQFDQAYSLGFQEEEQLAAAMRLVIHGGGSLQLLQRLAQLVYSFTHLWSGALRRALLQPFDADLFARLEPKLRTHLAEQMLLTISGLVESPTSAAGRLAAGAAAQGTRRRLPPTLRCRLAETLLFRGDAAGVQRWCDGIHIGWAGLVLGAQAITQGEWEAGAAQFEAAWKLAAAELGRRKNLASPAIGWIYVMALLALPTPAAWTKARKFVAAEAGKRDAADPFGFWGVWVDAIDQRLGDAPKAHGHFRTVRAERSMLQSLQQLHHLLLAAWLRVEVADAAAVRTHAARLAQEYDAAGMHWPARLARRAAASLLGEADEADACAVFHRGSTGQLARGAGFDPGTGRWRRKQRTRMRRRLRRTG